MFNIDNKYKTVITIVQWICIIVLLLICIFGYRKYNNVLEKNIEYQKENTHIKIYESQKINELKKENKELYDSIKKFSDVESAIEIRYKYKYVTDTLKVTEFAYLENDSVYHYEENNDTISLMIDLKAKELEWVTNKIIINDKFQIINRENNNLNENIIHHNPNVEIESVTAWHKQNNKKWYNNFHFGIQAGYGWGCINNKPDFFIGAGVTYVIK